MPFGKDLRAAGVPGPSLAKSPKACLICSELKLHVCVCIPLNQGRNGVLLVKNAFQCPGFGGVNPQVQCNYNISLHMGDIQTSKLFLTHLCNADQC